jgi:transcriptional regulator with XRE-family HTH domain
MYGMTTKEKYVRKSESCELAKTFAQKLIELRQARNLTQYELAEELKMARTMIAKWEYGKGSNPTLESIEKVATYFNVPPMSLLTNEEEVEKGKTGKMSKLELQVLRTKNLSTHKQKIIANMLEAFLDTN